MPYPGLKEQEATETTEQQASVSSVFSGLNDLAMHPLFTQASGITHDIIGAAIEVLGLIINFNSPKLTDGISRLILPGANLD